MISRISISRLVIAVFIVGVVFVLVSTPGAARPLQTNVGGVIAANTIWTTAGSPFNLTGDLSIASGATLTIQPGVTVNGGGHRLDVVGTLDAAGVAGTPVTFNNVRIDNTNPNGSGPFALIKLIFVTLDNSHLSSAGYGTLILRDSIIRNSPYDSPLYLWYPTSDAFIERNIFQESFGVSVGASDAVKVYIRNNVFFRLKTPYAVENWASYGSSQTVVEHNSFLSVEQTALQLPAGYTDAALTGANNYWNTTNVEIIAGMIQDKNDDPAAPGFIDFQPFLTAPHPNTPAFALSGSVSADPNTLQFRAKEGGANPPAKGITIAAPPATSWSVQTSGGAWLSAAPASGSGLGSAAINVNIAGLTPGTYTGSVSIGGGAVGSDSTNVELIVEDASTLQGLINENTTLTLAQSPYQLAGDVQVAQSVTLTVQPGVVVNGNDHNLVVLGKLYAVGTAQSPVVFNLAHIQAGNTSHSGPFFHIELQHARLNGGRLYEPTGSGGYGSLTLRDSVLSDTKIDPARHIDNNGLYIWYPTSDVVIERNIFDRSFGVSAGVNDGVDVTIRNNVFYGHKGAYDIKVWATYDDSQVIIEHNSFLNTGLVAVELPHGYNSAQVGAINNFWNTGNPAIMANMIYDRNDDLASGGLIAFEPFLTAPHSSTPTFAPTSRTIAPAAITFQAAQGGANPPPQSITVAALADETWSASANVAWLSVSPASGVGMGSVVVSANTAGLAAGSHSGQVIIGGSSSQVVQVTFKVEAGNVVGGIIAANATWGAAQSPYRLIKDVQIKEGATLTIEPGVVVDGDDFYLLAFGALNAAGSANAPVIFNLAHIALGDNSHDAPPAQINLQHVEMNRGRLYEASGFGAYGSLTLRDSTLTDTKPHPTKPSNDLYVWYPTSDVVIERTIFDRSYGVSVGTRENRQVTILNNVFSGVKGDFAVENWNSLDTSQTIVEHNSFLDTDKTAVSLPGGYNTAKLSAINNFWNTSDLAIIQAMIHDKNDDPSAADAIAYQPFLSAPHANTPLFINVIPSTLEFVATEGGAAPTSQSIAIGGAPGAWTASATSAGWLGVTPGAGSGVGTLTLSVNPTGLALGDYIGSVVVSAGSKQLTVQITLRVILDAALFRIDRDGLSFANYSYVGADWQHFKATFPGTLMDLPDGTPRKGPQRYFQSSLYQTIGEGGNCAGFTGVSLARFLNLSEGVALNLLSSTNQSVADPIDLPPGAPGNVRTGQSDVKDYIHLYQARQMSYEFARWWGDHQNDTPLQVFQAIKTETQANRPVAVDILSGKGGHRMTAFRTSQSGDTGFIHVYDSNWPSDATRRIAVNLTTGQWSYELWAGENWSDTKGLRYALAGLNFPGTLHPSFDNSLLAFAAAGDDATLLSLEGDVQPLVTDGQGNKLGYENGQLVSTISGAALLRGVGFNPADPAATGPETLYLPAGASYEVAIQPAASGLYTATLFGNGSAVSLDAVQSVAGQSDKLTLNGVLDVTFDPSNDGDYCHYVTREVTADASRSYESCVSALAGASVGFSLAGNGQLTVQNQGGAAIQVTSRIEQVGAGSGVQEQELDVAPGASATITAFGGDGAGNIYLPLIQR